MKRSVALLRKGTSQFSFPSSSPRWRCFLQAKQPTSVTWRTFWAVPE